MKSFDVFEAKNRFSEILGDVIRGEKYTITKHGVQVAMIIPFTQREKGADSVKNAIRAFKKLSKQVAVGKQLLVRKMMDEGRR